MRFAVSIAIAVSLTAQSPPGKSAITDAAQRGDLPEVSRLIAAKADVNAPQVDGTTALHWACERGDERMTAALITAKANVDARNRYGLPPIHLAAQNGAGGAVSMLLGAGADANTSISGGETALMTASRSGCVACVKALLAKDARVNDRETQRGQTALMWAAAEGHATVVEMLTAAGADVHARTGTGFTPILFAAREGRIAAARALLKAGANVNDTIQPSRTAIRTPGAPRAGLSAMVLAATNAHFELAAILVDAGADPNAAAPGYTALHVVTNVRKPGVGDNNPPPDGSGNMDSISFVRKLVRSGADVNARMTRKVNFGLTSLNTLGATPYFLAAKTSDAELMRVLKELGADPLIRNADESTALMASAGLGTRSPGEDAGTEPEVLEALAVALEHGVDINAVDLNGETAMHGAAYKNSPGAVRFLARRGADPAVWNKKNKQGWTPLRIAEGYRFGNYKPSPVTVEAILEVLQALRLAPEPSR